MRFFSFNNGKTRGKKIILFDLLTFTTLAHRRGKKTHLILSIKTRSVLAPTEECFYANMITAGALMVRLVKKKKILLFTCI